MIKELNDPVLNEAIDVVNSMSRDPKIREMIRQREFAEHERASIWADGNETGLVQGRQEGKDEERERIIANMRKSGMTEEQIQALIN